MTRALSIIIASVWVINGLFCKVLGLVPRHRDIVARILGPDHADAIAVSVGVAEVAMALWIVSNVGPRVNAITQIIIIATMNLLEFFLAPDLLLWGRLNALFASLLIVVIWYNEFRLEKS